MMALLRRVCLTAFAVLTMLGVSRPALAQDDGGGMSGGMTFDLNSVLVATFEASQPFLNTEAEKVRRLVEAALGDAYVVVKMTEVPAFTDYSADVYLRSCPQGQYIGCVFVVGGRAQTDWTIGGRITAVDGGYQVFLSFIKVKEAKLKLEFDVVLDGTNDREFQEGVVRTMDALVNDSVQDLDLRADPEANRAREAEAARRAQMSTDFSSGNAYQYDDARGDVGLDAYARETRSARPSASASEELGDDETPSRGGAGESGHVTWADLAAMEERGGMTPWERAGVTKGQYRIYRNSNVKLRDFKAKLQGRKGEFLIGVGGNVSSGSWVQFHETFFVETYPPPQKVKPSDILSEVATIYSRKGLAPGGVFDIGVGLAPWVELRVFAGLRSSSFQYRFYKEIEGAAAEDLKPPDARPVTTLQTGLKVNFVPMPAYPARPTFGLGVSYWAGTKLSKVVAVPDYLSASLFKPLAAIYVDLQPGLEISAGKYVAIYARADIDLPVYDFGRAVTVQYKPQLLTRLPDDARAPGLAIGGSLGLTLRIRVAGDR